MFCLFLKSSGICLCFFKLVNIRNIKVRVEDHVDKLNIKFTPKSLTNLFNISFKKIRPSYHSKKRILSNERVLTCNNIICLKHLLQADLYTVVEDIEYFFCFKFSKFSTTSFS
jgi:hypothetical protein